MEELYCPEDCMSSPQFGDLQHSKTGPTEQTWFVLKSGTPAYGTCIHHDDHRRLDAWPCTWRDCRCPTTNTDWLRVPQSQGWPWIRDPKPDTNDCWDAITEVKGTVMPTELCALMSPCGLEYPTKDWLGLLLSITSPEEQTEVDWSSVLVKRLLKGPCRTEPL